MLAWTYPVPRCHLPSALLRPSGAGHNLPLQRTPRALVRRRVARAYAAPWPKLSCPVGSRARALGGGSMGRAQMREDLLHHGGLCEGAEHAHLLAAHLGQRRASTPYVLRSSTAHSTREDAANSSPPRMRLQCFTVMNRRILRGDCQRAEGRRAECRGRCRRSTHRVRRSVVGAPAGGASARARLTHPRPLPLRPWILSPSPELHSPSPELLSPSP